MRTRFLNQELIIINFKVAWDSLAQKEGVERRIQSEIGNALIRPPRIESRNELKLSRLKQPLAVSLVASPYHEFRPLSVSSLRVFLERVSCAIPGVTW